jgi:hypothetical protein
VTWRWVLVISAEGGGGGLLDNVTGARLGLRSESISKMSRLFWKGSVGSPTVVGFADRENISGVSSAEDSVISVLTGSFIDRR